MNNILGFIFCQIDTKAEVFLLFLLILILSLVFLFFIRYLYELSVVVVKFFDKYIPFYVFWAVVAFILEFALLKYILKEPDNSSTINFFYDEEIFSEEFNKKDSIYKDIRTQLSINYEKAFHEIDSLNDIVTYRRDSIFTELINIYGIKHFINSVEEENNKPIITKDDLINTSISTFVFFLIGLIIKLERSK